MRVKSENRKHWVRVVCTLLLVVLAACGPAKTNANPTMSVEAIYTAAFQTLVAQQATIVALTPPTSTATPPEAPTLPPLALASPIATFAFASPTAGLTVGSACDSSAFVADVTIPDNTTIDPGKIFTKTWTLLNNGTCTWGTGYQLTFQSGDQLGGVNTPISGSVGPGSSVNLSVKLTAPTANGTYKGIWRMKNAANQVFGDTPWVIIKVGAGTNTTPVATGTACGTNCTIKGTLATGDTGNFKITFSGTTTTPSVTYTNNGFSFTVNSGWSGTITPSKGSYVFSPSSVTFTNVTTNQNVSFTLTQGPIPTATPH